MSVTDSITITQATNKVTVTAQGSVGLNAGGQIDGNLEVTGTLAVGGNQLGKDVRFWGETANKYFLWDASQDKVIITGDLQVDGTTTTINSTVVSIADPVFSLGGTSAPTSSDSKDRGIEHFYWDSTAGSGKRGFFGYSNADNAYKFLTDCPDPSGAEIFTGTAGKLLTGVLGVTGAATITGGALEFSGTSAGSGGSARYISSAGTSDSMFFNVPTNGDFYFAENNSTGFRLDFGNNWAYFSGLNVGIGTTAPSFTSGGGLQITHASQANVRLSDSSDASYNTDVAMSNADFYLVNRSSTGNLKFRVDGSTEAITVIPSGNVGIGTTTPQEQLHLYGASAAKMEIESAGGGDASLKFQVAAQSWSAGIDNGDSDKFKINTGSNPGSAAMLAIDSSGNVGIGTTAPAYKLDVDGDIRVLDGHKLLAGDGSDLELHHDATDSFLTNKVGDLTISNEANDKDIIFKSDDGSGGLETYFFLDGSASGGYPYTQFPDNSYLAFGSGNDLQIRHSGTKTEVYNYVGDLEFINYADDKDIIFQSDDGSGGVTAYFTLDGSLGYNVASKHILYTDSVKAQFGSSVDMGIQHNGTNSVIENATGDLELINGANDKDILFKCDDGSGGTTEYFRLDGSAAGSGNLFTIFPDSSYIGLGSNGTGDFIMAHNGTNTTFANYTGNLQISNNANDGDIIFKSDDGSGGLETYFFLDGSISRNVFTKHAQVYDNIKLLVGDGSDLQIYHDGTDSKIENGTGNLMITNNADDKDIVFQSDDGSGGLATYLTIDGGREEVVASKPLIQTPGTVDPANNGELAFTVVSNTSIKIKYKGTDGTVRSTTLTLS